MRTLLPFLLLVGACAGGSSLPPRDADRDGFPVDVDCDDRDPFASPGASEFCDGIDNDCDGAIDEDDALGRPTWYRDGDGDGFGPTGADQIVTCDPGEPGWGRGTGDCDDTDPERYPTAPEACDGIDNDCDGQVDIDPDVPRYADDDGDGWGDEDRPVDSCETPGSVRRVGDCDDGDPDVNPRADERCNGIDDDCDELVDDEDGDPVDPATWYPDADGDGVGVDEGITVVQCDPPNELWATATGDCDDGDPLSYPGAVQRCGPIDNDCDGQLPGDDGWYDPAWPVRVPLTLTGGAADADRPWITVDVDLRAALDEAGIADPADPEGLRVVVQDCADGARALDTQFTDGLSGLGVRADPLDPLGDEAGAVHALYDEVLPAGATVELALYLNGPAAPIPSDPVVATATSLEHGDLRVTFDPSRGGLLDDVVPDGGPVVLSQADAFEGNGMRTTQGWLSAARAAGTTTLVADGPLVGAVHGSVEVADVDAAHRYEVVWWLVSGRPELQGALGWSTTAASAWTDPADAALALRPIQVVSPGLLLPTVTLDPAGRWLERADGAWGSVVGWSLSPAFVVEAGTDSAGSWLAGNALAAAVGSSGDGAPADTLLVDQARLFVLPYEGASIDQEPARDALLDPPAVTIAGPADPL